MSLPSPVPASPSSPSSASRAPSPQRAARGARASRGAALRGAALLLLLLGGCISPPTAPELSPQSRNTAIPTGALQLSNETGVALGTVRVVRCGDTAPTAVWASLDPGEVTNVVLRAGCYDVWADAGDASMSWHVGSLELGANASLIAHFLPQAHVRVDTLASLLGPGVLGGGEGGRAPGADEG